MNEYMVTLHQVENTAETREHAVKIDAEIPLEHNDAVAGGMAVRELWEAEGVLYAVDSVTGPGIEP